MRVIAEGPRWGQPNLSRDIPVITASSAADDEGGWREEAEKTTCNVCAIRLYFHFRNNRLRDIA
jgi:hypothetical protein